jgi:L-2,4-diaminobutyrate decarboxylase
MRLGVRAKRSRMRLDEAFDAERFRTLAHRVVDELADHLARASARAETMAVLPALTPDAAVKRWGVDALERGGADLLELVRETIASSHHLHHPRYVGHQVTSPLPDAATTELVAALLNNSMAVYEMGPVSTAMERAVIAWMARRLGWRAGGGGTEADGVLTSGGSLGNLTALLGMRAAMSNANDDPRTLAVLVSDQAHYSVRRSIAMMGWGDEGVVAVPTDARFKMRVDALEEAHRVAASRGRRVIGVVASACSTATGAFDPLEAIADHCKNKAIWMHVDGAHGAVASLSPKTRALVAGVERADSIVWDAHKMMLVPSLVTAVIFRDGARSWDAFATRASYLFDGQERPWWDIALRTVECTKKMMALKVYAAIAVHGEAMFREYVERCFDRARVFAERARSTRDFELAVEPECNIVCFRYTPEGARDLDALNATIRKRIVESGRFYLVQTGLPRGTYLRVTIINPRTTDSDLSSLLDEIRIVARDSSLP